MRLPIPHMYKNMCVVEIPNWTKMWEFYALKSTYPICTINLEFLKLMSGCGNCIKICAVP